MNEVYEITGTELDQLLASLNTEAGIDKLSVAIDGGLKVKVNERAWTPPLGTLKQPRSIVHSHRSTHTCTAGCACRSWRCVECGTSELVDRRARYETEAAAPDQYGAEITDCCEQPICDQCVLAATHRCPQPGEVRG